MAVFFGLSYFLPGKWDIFNEDCLRAFPSELQRIEELRKARLRITRKTVMGGCLIKLALTRKRAVESNLLESDLSMLLIFSDG